MSYFPDPREATEEGIVAIGGELSIEVLLEAYSSGIFPWPQEGLPLIWFSPDPRGVLDFSDLRISRSLKKLQKKRSDLEFSFNKATKEVIHQCRIQQRKGQPGTWILPEMETAYQRLATEGHILSCEAWSLGHLVGGVYGVLFKAKTGSMVFSGESMFHAETGASKLCLLALVKKLQIDGLTWIDTQMVTEVVSALGGKYISKEDFLDRIGV